MSSGDYRKPLPSIDPLNRGFWDLAREGKLAVQRCTDCGDRHFPPGPVCPQCLGDTQEWEVVSGKGTLLSWVTFHRAYWDGFEKELPYDVCLVQLDEGPLLVSNLVGTPARPAGAPGGRADAPVGAGAPGGAVGDRVEVVFERATDEITLPKFRLAR
jgi:uncharacterized OB-fold protein